jgi:hypothetical protein
MRWIYQGENRTLRARSDFFSRSCMHGDGHKNIERIKVIVPLIFLQRYGTPSWLHTHSYFYTNSKRRLLCSM